MYWLGELEFILITAYHINLGMTPPANVVVFIDGGQVPQRCLVSKFMSSIKCFGLLPQVHAQKGTSLFWLSQREAQGSSCPQ